MLAVKIDNPEMENKFKQYAIEHKRAIEDVMNDAMKLFLDMNKKEDQIFFVKKDPMKHIGSISYDDSEDLSDVKPFSHIEDSAKYIHDLRRAKKVK